MREWTLQNCDATGALPVDGSEDAFLHAIGGPVSIRVPGRDRSRRRVVTTLLHGNERSGLSAMRRWLRERHVPETDTVLIIANVEAGLARVRMLPAGRDMNRCFLPPFDGPEGAIAEQILEVIAERPSEALIDLHNNTGHNPAYGVGVHLDAARLALTSLFGSSYVLTDIRLGAIMEALDPALPAVTIECGRAGDPLADIVAYDGLRAFLECERIDETLGRPVEVLHRPTRVCLRRDMRVAYADAPVGATELTMAIDIDRHNFGRVPAGEVVGWVDPHGPWPLVTVDSQGRERSRELFASEDGVLRARVDLVPIMVTTSPEIAQQDCLFYVVERRAQAE